MSMALRMPLERSSSIGAGSLEIRKFRKIESFSHSAFVYEDRREETVGADERHGLALEIYLPIFAELRLVHGDTRVENRVELVAVCPSEVQPYELVHLGVG